MNNRQFQQLHVEFLRRHPEPFTSWFERILPQRARGRWFLKVLPTVNGKAVLDVCGGYGGFGAYLHAVKKFSFDYTCVDKNPARVRWGSCICRAFGVKKPRFLIHDAGYPLPFPYGVFDMVWLFGWCDPFFNCDALFGEVSRVLKPGGLFLFNMAKSTAVKYRKSTAVKYLTRRTKQGLISLLRHTRFKVLRLDSIDILDYGVVAEK